MDTKEEADARERNTIRTLEPTQLLSEVSDGKNARSASLIPHVDPGLCARAGSQVRALRHPAEPRMFGAFT